jgi:hypothetical protein
MYRSVFVLLFYNSSLHVIIEDASLHVLLPEGLQVILYFSCYCIFFMFARPNFLNQPLIAHFSHIFMVLTNRIIHAEIAYNLIKILPLTNHKGNVVPMLN